MIKDKEKLLNFVKAILKGAISIIEITMSVPNALEVIRRVDKEYGEKVLVGFGSNAESKVNANRGCQS